jgi:hypothetical protein
MPSAVALARRYSDALAALRAIHAFDAWLGSYWRERCLVLHSQPVSYTPVGVSGSITWYECGGDVFGLLPGQDGCFQIPHAAAMPDFPFSLERPLPFELKPNQDVVIRATMRDELDLSGR